MKTILAILAATILLSSCATTDRVLGRVGKIADADIAATRAITHDAAVPDPVLDQCVVFIEQSRPIVRRILDYPTPGALSAIAKRRAKENLIERMRPQLAIACAPAYMDERQRLIRIATLLRGLGL